MYFSKLMLDVRNPSARQALRNCQDMHRNLMQAFDEDRRESVFLYRLIETRDRLEIYALSGIEPRWDRIAKLGHRYVGMRDVSALREMYRENAVLHFELLTSPTIKHRFDGKNSRRVFLRTESERLDWLERQANKGGFYLLEAHETGVSSQVNGSKAEGRIQFGSVVFFRVSSDCRWRTLLG